MVKIDQHIFGQISVVYGKIKIELSTFMKAERYIILNNNNKLM